MNKANTPISIEIITRAVIIHKNKLLVCLTKDPKPVMFLPGGHVEIEEKLEQGLKREIKEETGAIAGKIEFLGVFENMFSWHGQNHHEINFLYKVKLTSNPEKIHCRENHIDIEWVDLKKIRKVKIMPKIIRQYLVKLKDNKFQ